MSELQCPACLSTDSRLDGTKDAYTWQRCARCGTTFVPPHLLKDQELYDALYEKQSFGVTDDAARGSLQDAVRYFEPYRQTGRWLDLGYGQGGLLDVVERAGWQPHGVETAPSALKQARERGWTVCAPPKIAATFAPGSFDVVSLVEVIEHVPRGRVLLESAFSLLRPGGAIYVTTPNGRSLNRRVLGIGWSVFCAPDHVAIWTRRGAVSALTECGFRIHDVRTTGLNPVELRTARATVSEGVTNRNTAGFELNRALSSRSSTRLAKKAVNVGLTILGVGDTLKIHAVKG